MSAMHGEREREGDVIFMLDNTYDVEMHAFFYLLFTAKFPRAAEAARCTSTSCDCNKKRTGSSVSLFTFLTSANIRKQETMNNG